MSATTKSSGELTPPGSASGSRPLVVNGVAVPIGPRADRMAAESAFVTPPRRIEGVSSAEARRFTPRPDRLAEPLSAANAQALLPPQACVFVANLSNQRTDEQLAESVGQKFSIWGKCYVKVRRDKNNMPMAFVSYAEVEEARIAIRDSKGMVIDGRPVRVEHAKGERSVLLARHTGGEISDEEAREALARFGAIEETAPISVADQKLADLPEGRWVKFAYFLDCRDARHSFRRHEYFHLVTPYEDRHTPQQGLRRQNCAEESPFCSPAGPGPAPSTLSHHRSVVSPRWVPDSHALYIGDLPVDVTEEEIREVFDRFGKILCVDILKKRVQETGDTNTFAFVAYDNGQAVDGVLDVGPMLRGYRLRLERKEYTMRRNMRLGRPPPPPRCRQDTVLVQLYNQALRMGLPNDQAARILSVSQRPRRSSAYGDPACGSSPADRPAFDPSGPPRGVFPHRSRVSNADHQGNPAPSYGSSPYRPQTGNVNYQQVAARPMSHQYTQYASAELFSPTAPNFASQASSVSYPQLPARPMHEPHAAQYANAQLESSPSHYVDRGTTYYTDQNTAGQSTMPPGSGLSLEPIYGLGYSYNYENESYGPVSCIPDGNETEHRYSHESYGPATYAGEPYVPSSCPDHPGRG